MWRGSQLIQPANMKGEATVIGVYKIMTGTDSMFTDVSVREMPVLEKSLCPLPQQK